MDDCIVEFFTTEDFAAARKREYGTRQWKNFRAEMRKRMPWCAMCRTRPTYAIDHRNPHIDDRNWKQRFYDPAGVQGLCRSCHGSKTQRIDNYVNGCTLQDRLSGHHTSRRRGGDVKNTSGGASTLAGGQFFVSKPKKISQRDFMIQNYYQKKAESVTNN